LLLPATPQHLETDHKIVLQYLLLLTVTVRWVTKKEGKQKRRTLPQCWYAIKRRSAS